jgi:hypothetical protein
MLGTEAPKQDLVRSKLTVLRPGFFFSKLC